MLPPHKARYRIVLLPQEISLCASSVNPQSLGNHCSVSDITHEFYLFRNFIEMKLYSMHCYGSNFIQHVFEIHPYCCVYQESGPDIAD